VSKAASYRHSLIGAAVSSGPSPMRGGIIKSPPPSKTTPAPQHAIPSEAETSADRAHDVCGDRRRAPREGALPREPFR
jgi:hypothetical protein